MTCSWSSLFFIWEKGPWTNAHKLSVCKANWWCQRNILLSTMKSHFLFTERLLRLLKILKIFRERKRFWKEQISGIITIYFIDHELLLHYEFSKRGYVLIILQMYHRIIESMQLCFTSFQVFLKKKALLFLRTFFKNFSRRFILWIFSSLIYFIYFLYSPTSFFFFYSTYILVLSLVLIC